MSAASGSNCFYPIVCIVDGRTAPPCNFIRSVLRLKSRGWCILSWHATPFSSQRFDSRIATTARIGSNLCQLVIGHVSSVLPFPPNSAASCRAARSKAGEEHCPLRPPPRTSRRRNCRAAARTRHANVSSDSAAASSSNSAGDSRAAIWVMSSSSGAGPSGVAGVFLANPFRGRWAARAPCAMGLGMLPKRSGCFPSTTGLRVTSGLSDASPCLPQWPAVKESNGAVF